MTPSAPRDLLGPDDLDLTPVALAPLLLGCVLRHVSADGAVGIRLTEVEAYAGAIDPGSHAYRGRTARNASMFERGGRLYVYFTYGMHYCANLVCGAEGDATGLLLRAGAVVEGAELALARRAVRTSTMLRPRDLARGPANLARCLGVDRTHDGMRLGGPGDPLTLTGPLGTVPGDAIRSGPRVGLSGPGGDGAVYPWRFWVAGEPTVSVYRPAVARNRRRR